MGKDSFRGKVAIAYGIEHGCMSAKESTPTHTDSCKYRDSIAINPTMSDKSQELSLGLHLQLQEP